ncbi:MAG: BTAD domain-containing putative transcriptional regulator [Gemmatimonadota bacterium]
MILKTFGGLTLVRDQRPVSGAAAQRRRLALLAMVEAAGPAGISRERLVGVFWGEGEEDRGRRNLAQAVYALRRDLEVEELFTGTNELRINPLALGSDRADFLAAVDGDRLEAAVELYTGRFLDGFYLNEAPEFDRWMETERARLAHDAAGAMEMLAGRAASRSDHHGAIRWWRTLAAAEPHNARAAQGLMRALAAAGDLTAADQHARSYQAQLESVFELPPDPAVAALAESLRRSAPTAPPAAAAVANPSLLPASGLAGHTDEYARPRPASDGVPPPYPPPSASAAPSARANPTASPPTRLDKRRRTWALPVAAMILIAAAVLWRQRSERAAPASALVLAVGTIRNYTHQPDATAPLSDMLATNLARSPGLSVVSGARMVELSSQAGWSGDSDRTALTSAKEAGATQIVDGALYRLGGGRFRLDLRRVDVAHGTVMQAIAVEDTSLFTLADEGAAALAEGSGAGAPEHPLASVSTGSVVAFRLYEEGLRALYTGDYAGARQMLSAALREDSTFAMAAYYRARAQPADRAGYIAELQHAVELARRSSDRERLLITGWYADEVDDPVRLAIAETLTVRYPTEPEGFKFLGHARMWDGDFLNALPPLRQAMVMDSASLRRPPPGPGGPASCLACEALSELSGAYFMADSSDAALKVARDWTRFQPASAPAWASLALLYAKLDRFAEAAKSDSMVVRLDPGSDQGGLRIDIALRSGDFATADRLIGDYLNGSSPLALAYAQQSQLTSYRMQGRFHDALPAALALRKAGVQPSIRGAAPYEAVYQASVLYDAGRPAEAAALFDSIGRNPLGESPARRARHRTWMATLEATAQAAAGDTTHLRQLADSAQAWGQLSGYGRDRRLHHHIRGLLLEARGDLAGATREYRSAIFSATVGYTMTSLAAARLLMRLNQPGQALPLLRSALEGPFDGPNLYLSRTVTQEAMATAFAQAGQRDSARVYRDRVAAAWKHRD